MNFGLIYGMGAKGLRDYAQNTYGVTMTEEQAHLFLSGFFEAYQGVANWHKKVREARERESRTILGRRRLWDGESKITELLNSPIQGTAADITKKALSMLPEALQGIGTMIIGCVHDDIILESPIAGSEQVGLLLKGTMLKSGQEYLKQVPLEVELGITESWVRT